MQRRRAYRMSARGTTGMVNMIYVEPMADGWAVRQDLADNHQVFSSGAKAEDAAMRLAQRLARAGQPSEVQVYLRGGALAGRFACPALEGRDLAVSGADGRR